MDGEAIFVTGRGGAGRGLAKNLWDGAGRGTPPSPQCGAGRGTPPPRGEGSPRGGASIPVAYCWVLRILSGVICRIITIVLNHLHYNFCQSSVHSSCSAEHQIGRGHGSNSAGRRCHNYGIISKLLLLISNHCYLLLIMGTMKQFGRSSLLNTTQ